MTASGRPPDLLLNSPFSSADGAAVALEEAGYITDRDTAVVAWLAGSLGRPLLIEGPAGVGKTELAKAVARASGRELIRLQCYEGVDESRALYEWEYAKQLLYTQLVQDAIKQSVAGATSVGDAIERISADDTAFFHERFLVRRPLLAAIESPEPVVLLIDEVDRADTEFEALLLEVLSDFQVTIPELGTRRATALPYVVLTSNGTRQLTEALRRRCLFLSLGYPSAEREKALLLAHIPKLPESLAHAIVAVAQSLRDAELRKPPSISETLDWAHALVMLNVASLDERTVKQTLGTIIKVSQDFDRAEAVARETLKATEPSTTR